MFANAPALRIAVPLDADLNSHRGSLHCDILAFIYKRDVAGLAHAGGGDYW